MEGRVQVERRRKFERTLHVPTVRFAQIAPIQVQLKGGKVQSLSASPEVTLQVEQLGGSSVPWEELRVCGGY